METTLEESTLLVDGQAWMDDSCIEDTMDESMLIGSEHTHNYIVDVRTGSQRWAGTEAKVYLQLVGDRGETSEVLLGNNGKFEGSSVQRFSFAARFVGNLTKVVVRHDSEAYRAWFLESLSVQDVEGQLSWDFDFCTWFSSTNGDVHWRNPTREARREEAFPSPKRPKPYGAMSVPPPNGQGPQRTRPEKHPTDDLHSLLGCQLEASPEYFETHGTHLTTPQAHEITPVQKELLLVTFALSFNSRNPNLRPYVTGSSQELGAWEKRRALPMNRYTNASGIWGGEWRLQLPTTVCEIEYRYLIVDESTGKITETEEPMRRVDLRESTQVTDVVGVSGTRHVRDRWETPVRKAPDVGAKWRSLDPFVSPSVARTPSDRPPVTPSLSVGRTLFADPMEKPSPVRSVAPAPAVNTTHVEEISALMARVRELERDSKEKELLAIELDTMTKACREVNVEVEAARKVAVDKEVTLTKLRADLHDASRRLEDVRALHEGEKRMMTDEHRCQLEQEMTKRQDLEEKLRHLEEQVRNQTQEGQLVPKQTVHRILDSCAMKVRVLRSQTDTLIDEWRKRLHDIHGMIDQLTSERDKAIRGYQKEFQERRRLFNEVQELRGNIRVFCRVRPSRFADSPLAVNFPDARDSEAPSRIIASGRSFEFDRVFDPDSNQASVYEAAAGVITSVVDGYNVCVFAYGQTGSGKTYTMDGTLQDPGVNSRALSDLFRIIDERSTTFNFQVKVAQLEIYNEQLRDLLRPDRGNKLDIKRGHDGSMLIPDLEWVTVEDAKDVWKVMGIASENRSKGSTDMNEHSSRSHLVVCVEVRGENTHTGVISRGLLNLIDLAGSERIARSNVSGERLKEAQYINKSLAALGDVFMALLSKASHIPFRNSKLTYLLQDSLGGDSKNLMFVNVSCEQDDCQETISSLNFASRVAKVQLGKAAKHSDFGESDRHHRSIKERDTEIAKLKDQISNFARESEVKEDATKSLASRIEELQERAKSSDEEVQSAARRVFDLESQLLRAKSDLDEERERVRHLTEEIVMRTRVASGDASLRASGRATETEPSPRISSPSRRPLADKLSSSVDENVLEASPESKRENAPSFRTPRLSRQVRFMEVTGSDTTASVPQGTTGSYASGPPKRAGTPVRGNGSGGVGPKRVVYAFGSRMEIPMAEERPQNRMSSALALKAAIRRPAERVAKRPPNLLSRSSSRQ